jgi:hypothetical protein
MEPLSTVNEKAVGSIRPTCWLAVDAVGAGQVTAMQAFTSLLLFMFSAVDLIFVFTLSLHYLRQVWTTPTPYPNPNPSPNPNLTMPRGVYTLTYTHNGDGRMGASCRY